MSNCKCGSEPLEHGRAEYTERVPQLDAVNKPEYPGRPGKRRDTQRREKSSGRARYHEGKIRSVLYNVCDHMLQWSQRR